MKPPSSMTDWELVREFLFSATWAEVNGVSTFQSERFSPGYDFSAVREEMAKRYENSYPSSEPSPAEPRIAVSLWRSNLTTAMLCSGCGQPLVSRYLVVQDAISRSYYHEACLRNLLNRLREGPVDVGQESK